MELSLPVLGGRDHAASFVSKIGDVRTLEHLTPASPHCQRQAPDELRRVHVALSVDLHRGTHAVGQRRFHRAHPPAGDRVEPDLLPGVADLLQFGQESGGVALPAESGQKRLRAVGIGRHPACG